MWSVIITEKSVTSFYPSLLHHQVNPPAFVLSMIWASWSILEQSPNDWLKERHCDWHNCEYTQTSNILWLLCCVVIKICRNQDRGVCQGGWKYCRHYGIHYRCHIFQDEQNKTFKKLDQKKKKFVMSVCEDNCLAWLQGPPGDFGPKGTQGPKGPQGAMVGST